MEVSLREDMAQVITERPRDRGPGYKGYREVRSRGGAVHNLERLAELPRHEGMRRPYPDLDLKEFADLLGPLRKFLVRQVGRPWNKVHSEICERISPNSIVQRHILGHLYQIIDTKTSLAPDGRVLREPGYHRRPYVADIPGQLYVHPVTGIIRRTPEGPSARKRQARAEAPDPKFKSIGPERELWQRDGIWYWAVFATARPRPMPAADGEVSTQWPTDCFTGDRVALGARYRTGKRQASGRDLRQYGLANEAPAQSRLSKAGDPHAPAR
jgi:hypothetical protein